MITLRPKRQCKAELMELGSYGFCFGGKDAPDPPDLTPIADASMANAKIASDLAEESVALGREQFEWGKERWAEEFGLSQQLIDTLMPIFQGQTDLFFSQTELMQDVQDTTLPILEAQAAMAGEGMDAFLDYLDTGMTIARDTHEAALRDRDRYVRIFQPIEDDLVQEFLSYDTQGRRALEAGLAQADVARAQDAQRKQMLMNLESYGIDPSQTRMAALDATLRTAQAADQAAAGNAARKRVEDVGRALRSEAINIGKGYPSQVASSYGTALAAGQGTGTAGLSAANAPAGTAGTLLGSTTPFTTGSAALGTSGALAGLGSLWQGAGGFLGSPTSFMGMGGNFLGTANQGLGTAGNLLNAGYGNEVAAFESSIANSPLNTIAGLAGMGLGGYGLLAAEGGEVSGPEGRDVIPAKLSDGEFIIPESVVRRKGTEFFEKLIAKTQEDQARKDAEMDQQQMRERAYQGMAARGGAPGPAYMADGGQPPKPPMFSGGQQPKTTTFSGANPRPMFGYSSELAQEEMARSNQATQNRTALVNQLQQEMANKEWLKIKSDLPAPRERGERPDISKMIADSRANREVERARQKRERDAAALALKDERAFQDELRRKHELDLARIKAQNQPAAPAPVQVQIPDDVLAALPWLQGQAPASNSQVRIDPDTGALTLYTPTTPFTARNFNQYFAQ